MVIEKEKFSYKLILKNGLKFYSLQWNWIYFGGFGFYIYVRKFEGLGKGYILFVNFLCLF